jgi:hypothetical protein
MIRTPLMVIKSRPSPNQPASRFGQHHASASITLRRKIAGWDTDCLQAIPAVESLINPDTSPALAAGGLDSPAGARYL